MTLSLSLLNSAWTVSPVAKSQSPDPLPSPIPPSFRSTAMSASSSQRDHGNPSPHFTAPPNYTFPHHRLNLLQRYPEKQPIVLVACGSFSPVTYLHLRMFEMAVDYARQNTDFEVMGGYMSPVSDQYKKPGLLSAHHR